jgi:hypothetical protein
VFVLGLLIVAFQSLAPLGVLLWDWAQRWNDPPDMTMFWHQAIVLCGLGVWRFWSHYKAQIALPPAWAAARDLAAQIKTVTTTQTVEQTKFPPATITTTVQETKTTSVPAEPQPAPIPETKGN